MNTWFVSTVHRLPGKTLSFIWGMREFESESAARHYAKVALNNGLQVEAGTLPEIEPQVRIAREDAMAWAAVNEGQAHLLADDPV